VRVSPLGPATGIRRRVGSAPWGPVRATAAALALAGAAGCGTGDVPGVPNQLYLVKRDGSDLRQVTHGPQVSVGPAWAPDSRRIATGQAGGIEISMVDGSGSDLIPVANLTRSLAWSGDGASLDFLTRHGPSFAKGGWVGSVHRDGSALRQFPLGKPVLDAGWGPRGWPLIFVPGNDVISSGGRVKPVPDLWELDRLDGRPQRLLELPGRESYPTLSPNASRILFADLHRARNSVWSLRRGGTRPRRLLGDAARGFPSWSPDGDQVVLPAARRSGTGPNETSGRRLYTLPAAGGELRQIAAETALAPAAWSPDGDWIAFVPTQGAIALVRPDGADRHDIVSLGDRQIHHLAWSPDGTELAFVVGRKPVRGYHFGD
jgi:Tol biopolymer transport system component